MSGLSSDATDWSSSRIYLWLWRSSAFMVWIIINHQYADDTQLFLAIAARSCRVADLPGRRALRSAGPWWCHPSNFQQSKVGLSLLPVLKFGIVYREMLHRHHWFADNDLLVNADKSEMMLFGSSPMLKAASSIQYRTSRWRRPTCLIGDQVVGRGHRQ